MANKLYEENSIKDIANAIRSINGETKTYKVAEMGEAIRKIRKVYSGVITDTTVGMGEYQVLAKDSFLAEHRADPTLFVRIKFDVEPQPYTIVETWCVGDNRLGYLSAAKYQVCMRYDGSGNRSFSTPNVPVTSTAYDGVGCVLITEDGDLQIYSNSSSNYAIRKSKFTVIVECQSEKDGGDS
jgi:hypothetical protein